MSTGYTFDCAFQTKIAAMILRDGTFSQRSEGLIEPGYFSIEAEAHLVALQQAYWGKYRSIPSTVTFDRLVNTAIAAKRIRSDLVSDVQQKLAELHTTDISDRDFVLDEVSAFAKQRAIELAMDDAIDHLKNKDFVSIETKIKRAFMVGANDMGIASSDFGDRVSARAQVRRQEAAAIAAGLRPANSISTGCPELDDMLYWKGYGRGELSLYMGGAKRGKSIILANSSANSWLAGYNVLHVSLENGMRITEDRMESYVSKVPMNDLMDNIAAVEAAMTAASSSTAGKLKIHQYPGGGFRPADLRRLFEHYKAQGLAFDQVTLDYPDLMTPDRPSRDGKKVDDSAQVYRDIRDHAAEENYALVGATQTNRVGYKAHVADADHVAEDFNRIRIADVVISINQDEDEKENGLARLYFAASRNQLGGTLHIQQALDRMCFIDRVLPKGTF